MMCALFLLLCHSIFEGACGQRRFSIYRRTGPGFEASESFRISQCGHHLVIEVILLRSNKSCDLRAWRTEQEIQAGNTGKFSL